jgi:hypothetical protein
MDRFAGLDCYTILLLVNTVRSTGDEQHCAYQRNYPPIHTDFIGSKGTERSNRDHNIGIDRWYLPDSLTPQGCCASFYDRLDRFDPIDPP